MQELVILDLKFGVYTKQVLRAKGVHLCQNAKKMFFICLCFNPFMGLTMFVRINRFAKINTYFSIELRVLDGWSRCGSLVAFILS